ncbi:type II toxin-antitoxin system VapC family toxin [Neomoorella thermoacetica]|uniref:type II toxin-antitoxin system VapC family toxin n=1 Tax=Neomoorella thermoacetica TaxID=1525 RepID=UPI0009BA187D|nr:type II toxin-antitoxin system VapC family toxin [Moorella thermoacetica]
MADVTYLLDTTVFIDVSRGNKAVIDWLISWADEPGVLATSTVVVAEYFSSLPIDKRNQAKDYLLAFNVLPVTFEDAVHAGEIRWDYARKGITLALADALHGAIAVRRGLTVVTSNPAHFPFVSTFNPRK